MKEYMNRCAMLFLKFSSLVTSQKLWLIKKYGIVRIKKLLYFLGWDGGIHRAFPTLPPELEYKNF